MICRSSDRGHDCDREAVVVVRFNDGYFGPNCADAPEIEPECEFHFRVMQAEVDSLAVAEENEHCYRVVQFLSSHLF